MRSWRKERTDSFNWKYGEDTLQMPEEVTNWLVSLSLLSGIPLTYLVPDQRTLPTESIGFFFIDPQWTGAMLEGATSIGVHTTKEAHRSAVHQKALQWEAQAGLYGPRFERMHVNHRRSMERKMQNGEAVLSGFLMRSSLVPCWKGIEVQGFSGEERLEILAMRTLSEKILICIFDGEITSVKMFEPRENLHFGTRSKAREITVRRIDEGHEGEPLYEAGTRKNAALSIPCEENGRLKVSELARQLAEKLGRPQTDIGSPQFALEMLSVAGQCEFKRG